MNCGRHWTERKPWSRKRRPAQSGGESKTDQRRGASSCRGIASQANETRRVAESHRRVAEEQRRKAEKDLEDVRKQLEAARKEIEKLKSEKKP